MARTRYALRGWWIVCLAAFWLAPAMAFAADPVSEVQARVAAGEFGPAVAAAGAVNNAMQRDGLLGAIAAAQAGAGGRRAAPGYRV